MPPSVSITISCFSYQWRNLHNTATPKLASTITVKYLGLKKNIPAIKSKKPSFRKKNLFKVALYFSILTFRFIKPLSLK